MTIDDFASNEIDINEINEQIHTRGWQETAKLSWMPFKEARDIGKKF